MELSSKRNKSSTLWGTLAALFAVCAVLLCVIAPSVGILVAIPFGDPQDTVTGFFDALTAGDYDRAYTYLGTYSDLGLGNAPTGQAGQILLDALRESYSCELVGECETDKLSARQRVEFTYMDIPSVEEDAAGRVMDVLSGFVADRPATELYDEDHNYLPQVAQEAYAGAVTAALEASGGYTAAADLTLELEYTGGRWLLIPGQELLSALSGGTASAALTGQSQMDLVARLDTHMNNAASDALSGLTYIPKHYTIPEDALSGPAPDKTKFGSTYDPREVMAVIESAAELLGDQETAFDPEAQLVLRDPIRYYCDETILAIAWKQVINGHCCAIAEVKIADASQLRRKLSGDAYGSSVRSYASEMAKEVNAVLAINGDYYAFRSNGITAYQRQLFRCTGPRLETCFFTASGDMLFSRAGELTEWDATERFIEDNDVLFAVTFGPILVDNGELCNVYGYPLGQGEELYSRCALGMLDELHYLGMTINYESGYGGLTTVMEMSRCMRDIGCVKAYAMDGGQTAVIFLGDELINHVDFGTERTMSDIIYFATALPEEEQR